MKDIVFDAGQFAPHTDTGKRLIAHELSHVAQQQSTLRRQPVGHFTPAKFNNPHALVAAAAKASPSQKELAGACIFLDALSTSSLIALVQAIAARKADALEALEANGSRGFATDRVTLVLQAVRLAGTIGRTGFALEHEHLSTLRAADADQVLPEIRGNSAFAVDYLIGGSTSVSEKAAAMRALFAGLHVNKDDPATFRKFVTDEKYLQESVETTYGKASLVGTATIGSATVTQEPVR